MFALSRFFREMRRRRVFRTAALYIVGAWLVMQAADVFFPAWGIPDAAINYLLLAAILGFPVALVFGWQFDITAQGIVRTKSADTDELSAALPLRRGDYLILAALVAVAGVILYNTTVGVIRVPLQPNASTHALEKIDNSIAVLPFDNMSSDPENAYLADGVAEEILNRLGALRDLHVIARTSSFALKGSGFDIPRLSDVLGVRYLLQGSVRRDRNMVRISAQLIDESGRQLWSDSYDRELKEIFQIQREIAEAVAGNVAPQMSTPGVEDSTINIEAYQHYLIGRELVHKRAGLWLDDATAEFEQAIEIDPQYAEPYAELAILSLFKGGWGFSERPEKEYERARRAIEKALSLQPDLARAYAARGLLLHFTDRDPESEAPLRKALALEPNMTDASNWLATTLSLTGRPAEAGDIIERAARFDPLALSVNLNVALNYANQGDFAQAEGTLLRLLKVPQPAYLACSELTNFYFATGRLVDGHEIAKRCSLSVTESDEYAATFLLAENYSSLGMGAPARYWYERDAYPYPDWVGWFVETWMLRREGRFREMADIYRTAFASKNLAGTALDSKTTAQFGLIQALAGDRADAIRTLESGLDVDSPESMQTNEVIDGLQALAWMYFDIDANGQGAQILDAIERNYKEAQAGGRLHRSPELLLFAQNAVVAGDEDLALARLREAIDAGWRDYYTLAHDPRWDEVRENPRFQDLMAAVKSDLDAQRARVEEIDAEDDFVARFDRVLAAAQAATDT